MSSKFFTWTKGDRRAAAETLRTDTVVKIPAELKLYGTGYPWSAEDYSNNKNNSAPLSVEHGSESRSQHSSRSKDSIKLHDAAVRSATCLLSVVNDMLRSPHLSAHLSSQQHSAGFSTIQTRPRSRTAPPIPLIEAPPIEPVELPGSLVLEDFSLSSLKDVVYERPVIEISNASSSEPLKDPIVGPQTSPQDHKTVQKRKSLDVGRWPGDLQPPPESMSQSRIHSPNLEMGILLSNRNTPCLPERPDSPSADMRPPPLTVIRPPGSSNFVKSAETPYDGITPVTPQVNALTPLQRDGFLDANGESILFEHAARLHKSHETHVRSLKDAYEKEIDLQKSYIAFLEKRQVDESDCNTQEPSKQSLTIDTARCGPWSKDLLSTSASAPISSVESPDSQKTTSQEAASEAEALKRKVSLYRRAQLDSVELRRERDQLRESNRANDRRILQLKDIVHRNKESEKALKKAVDTLEARLVHANNERIDVREGFEEACTKIRTLTEREKRLGEQLDDLQTRLFYSHPTQRMLTTAVVSTNQAPGARSRHQRASSAAPAIIRNSDPLSKQIEDFRMMVAERDTRICTLEAKVSSQTSRSPKTDAFSSPSQSEKIWELEKQLAAARADAERFNSILQSELRRQTRQAAEKSHSSTPKIESDALALAAEKTGRLRAQIEAMHSRDNEKTAANDTAAILEHELQHCIKEIIMYKLDVRGYKKDLKRTRAKLEELQTIAGPRPLTPVDSSSNASSAVNSSIRFAPAYSPGGLPSSSRAGSGLGISTMPNPHTPTRSGRGTRSLCSPVSNSQANLRTPLSVHKELPRTPDSRPTSPQLPKTPPIIQVERAGTLRSLSESIISSYAKPASPQPSSEKVRRSGSLRPHRSPKTVHSPNVGIFTIEDLDVTHVPGAVQAPTASSNDSQPVPS